MSGGVGKLIKGTNDVGKSRVSTAIHNQSMYEKLGAHHLQVSPGPTEFQGGSNHGKMPPNYNSIKPLTKSGNVSSFDSMPLSNQLSSIQISQAKGQPLI